MCIILYDKKGRWRRREKGTHSRTHTYTQEHAHTHTYAHTQYLVHDSMVFHCLHFKYSQQHRFYNRWWIHQSLLFKAKAKMNLIMRKKHLELQSGWAKRRLSASWQNSVQREYGQLAVSQEGMSCRSAGSCLEPVMLKGLTFPPPRAEQREGPRTLKKPNWKPDTQARRTSLGIFFPFSPSEEGSDTVQGWPGWQGACGLSYTW